MRGKICSQIEYFPTALAHEIGHHRHHKIMMLTRGSTHNNGTLWTPTAHKAWPQATHNATHNCRCLMLVIDLQIASCPLIANAHHRRAENFRINLFHADPSNKCSLNHGPCSAAIAGKQTSFKSFPPHHIFFERCFSIEGLRVQTLELTQIVEQNTPCSCCLVRGQKTQAHIAVCGHVVDVEHRCCFMQRNLMWRRIFNNDFLSDHTLTLEEFCVVCFT